MTKTEKVLCDASLFVIGAVITKACLGDSAFWGTEIYFLGDAGLMAAMVYVIWLI